MCLPFVHAVPHSETIMRGKPRSKVSTIKNKNHIHLHQKISFYLALKIPVSRFDRGKKKQERGQASWTVIYRVHNSVCVRAHKWLHAQYYLGAMVNQSLCYLFTVFHYRKFDAISYAPPYLMSSEHVIPWCRVIVSWNISGEKFPDSVKQLYGNYSGDRYFFFSGIASNWNINCNEYASINLDAFIWTFSTSQVISLLPIRASQIAIIFLHYYFHELILFLKSDLFQMRINLNIWGENVKLNVRTHAYL